MRVANNVRTSNLEQLLRPTVEAMGFEIWGVDYTSYKNHSNLCVFIDSSAGITVDDCANVSNQIDAVLEVETHLPTNMTLQVSSPGMDRILFNTEHYQRTIGEELDIRLAWPKEGRTHLRGRLVSCDDEQFTIEENDNEKVVVKFAEVRRTRIVPNLDEIPR